MEARFKNKLPQEGSSSCIKAGESLSEQSPVRNSGCPTDSGGGKILQSHEDRNKTKILSQQIFNKGMFNNKPQPTPTNKQTEDWNDVLRSKRLRSSPDNHGVLKQKKLDTYWLSNPFSTSNRFANLEVDSPGEPTDKTDTEVKLPKPPPIFVDRVSNIKPLITLLNNVGDDSYELKVLPNERVKIQPKAPDTYIKIVKELENKKTEFYTYKPKEDRNFKVMLKNMHPSTDPEDIKEALSLLEHECTNIWNVKRRITKEPLPMFTVELKQKENNKSVYDIKSLLHCRVIFEPPRPKREIPQCGNCQQYGHTKTYCRRSPKCIKCAGDHLSAKCSRKTRSDDVKCVLCGGNHPANYKGCSIYRELEKIRFPSQYEKKKTQIAYKMSKQQSNPQLSQRNPTYSEVLAGYPITAHLSENMPTSNNNNNYNHNTINHNTNGNNKYNETYNNSNDIRELMDMMKQIMTQLTTMTNLMISLTTKLIPSSIPSK